MGLASILTFLTYLVPIAALSLAGNYMALLMWVNIDANEDTKTHLNKLTTIQGYKYLTVGIIVSVGGWLAALGLGE